nr:MAG TPA: hypothetical protein [Bacteriophage sp.]DAJ17439.1 MAG TPA: hypothetical protein [Siphoviridae sp. ctuCR5]DAZ42975.1 MAG TPA: hypothetical protein [Caudoviricetes sp.]
MLNNRRGASINLLAPYFVYGQIINYLYFIENGY